MSRMTFWLGPGVHDLRGPAGADAVHVAQLSGMGVDDVEHARAERIHELLREHRPDAAYEARAEVALDAVHAGGRLGVHRGGAELGTVDEVVGPLPDGRDVFPGRDRRGIADQRLELAPRGNLHADHAEAVLRVVERHALDGPGDRRRVEPRRAARCGRATRPAAQRQAPDPRMLRHADLLSHRLPAGAGLPLGSDSTWRCTWGQSRHS